MNMRPDTEAMRRARLMQDEEAARIAEVKAMGHVPKEVGPMVPEAPARGPVRMFDATKLYPKGEADYEAKPAGWKGRKTLQRADVFDVMLHKAKAAHTRAVAKARNAGKPEEEWPVFVPPLSFGQMSMGRFYRDLTEKHTCAGVKCSSLESLSQSGGGTGGEFMDAVLRDRMRLDALHRRIGSGIAKEVRRIRPSETGSRATIMDRRLVDMVCLEDQNISDVLRAHGWVKDGQAAQSKHIKALRVALSKALNRMMGPRFMGIKAADFGPACTAMIWDQVADQKKGD